MDFGALSPDYGPGGEVDLSALDPIRPSPFAGEGRIADAELMSDCPVDSDGLPIPPMWHFCRDRWEKQAYAQRRHLVEVEIRKRRLKPAPKEKRRRTGPAPTRFTTDAAIRWGRRQGWRLIERESFDHLTKRHHDLELGMDAKMEDSKGLIFLQGAGRGERAAHRRRFEERGGEAKARRRHYRVIYLEFVRGKPDPVLREDWVE